MLPGFESVAILCNKPSGRAGVHERARRLGIPLVYVPRGEGLLQALDAYTPDLVLGLGYTRKVPDDVLAEYENRVLNIHPTLLPKHGGKGMYGLATHLAVLEMIRDGNLAVGRFDVPL